MHNFLKLLLTPEFFFSILRISAPIIFATLAAVVVEKAGFANIGLEGLMMFSALSGSLVSYYSQSWFWGLLAALAAGIIMSLVMGFFAFQLKTDIILVGIAINMMGSGGTLFLCKVITNLTEGKAMASTTGLITRSLCIPDIRIPILNRIPFLGSVLSGHNLLTYLAFILVVLTSVILYKTPLGLNIRSVGENTDAAASVGVSVLRVKYIAIAFSGLMSGFGGAFMSMSYAQGWSQDMVSGRGFIALAAQAMGGGECLGGTLSAIMFGFAQALGIKFSAIGMDSNLASPIPYAVTIIGLVVFALVRISRTKKRRFVALAKEDSHLLQQGQV
jgi:simple sugar transport system permease protein